MIKLDAINAVLRRNGYTPVSGLDTAGNSAESQAERFLDDADSECQSNGWYFNTLKDVTLSINGSGNILVPTSTYYRLDTSGDSYLTNVRVRNGMLYDTDANTDVWSAGLVVSYSEKVAWSDLPEAFAMYIISRASLAFNRSHKKDQALDKLLIEEVASRWAGCKRQDNDMQQVNLLDTPEMNQLRGRPKMQDRSI
tara:strand:- start:819 stop:1406 length:588 start_codon:yes stop_codon:yes gene_type:complete